MLAAHPIIRGMIAGLGLSVFFLCTPISRAQETKVYYFLTNHLGSVDVVLDENGEVVERRDFFPYGAERMTEGTDSDTDRGFTGKELDEETGLNYYGARYYDSTTGRFISLDPWEGDLSDPQSLNKYTYTLNNPVNFIDPTGEESTPVQKVIRNFIKYLANKDKAFQEAVKDATAVVVTRDAYEGTTIRGETYYKDNLSVKVGTVELNNLEVQSTVDYPGTPADWALPDGSSYNAKIGESGATKKFINDTLRIDGAYFFHSPAKDNKKPYSQGCTIPKTNADKEEVMDILRQDIGFKNGETVRYNFEAFPQSEKDKDEDKD